jgi:hypothetical protein
MCRFYFGADGWMSFQKIRSFSILFFASITYAGHADIQSTQVLASKSYVDQIVGALAGNIGTVAGTIAAGDDARIVGAEQVANKAVSISAASTDNQYPSAKAVYDAIAQNTGVVGPAGPKGDTGLSIPIYTTAIDNATNGTESNRISEISVNVDGLRFSAYKAESTYWGVRIKNLTGGTIAIASSSHQIHGGTTTYEKRNTALANNAEFNPDTESNDVGYGTYPIDTFVSHVINLTSMNLYRWTTTVYQSRAVLVVEKLH